LKSTPTNFMAISTNRTTPPRFSRCASYKKTMAKPVIWTVDDRLKVLASVDFPSLGRSKGSWYPAVPPLCRSSSGLCPADYFGRTMVANLPEKIRVGVVKVSVAGCMIELFDKDNFRTYASTALGSTSAPLRSRATQGGTPPTSRSWRGPRPRLPVHVRAAQALIPERISSPLYRVVATGSNAGG
jgi:hypothetical protein